MKSVRVHLATSAVTIFADLKNMREKDTIDQKAEITRRMIGNDSSMRI